MGVPERSNHQLQPIVCHTLAKDEHTKMKIALILLVCIAAASAQYAGFGGYGARGYGVGGYGVPGYGAGVSFYLFYSRPTIPISRCGSVYVKS